MNLIITGIIIFVLVFLLLSWFVKANSKKVGKSVRNLIFIFSLLIAIILAIGGRILFSLPLFFLAVSALKIKGLGYSETQVKKAFLDFIGEIEESLFNKDFTLNFGEDKNVLGINVAYSNLDNIALIKLYEPLPPDIEKGTQFWIVEEIIEPLEFKVDLGHPDEPDIFFPKLGEHLPCVFFVQ